MTTPVMQAEVSQESTGKSASSAVGSPRTRNWSLPCSAREPCEQNWIKPCQRKPFDLWKLSESEVKNGNSREAGKTPLTFRDCREMRKFDRFRRNALERGICA
jgi:hypothetical protein